MADNDTKTDRAYKHSLGVAFTSEDKKAFEETLQGGAVDHLNQMKAENIDSDPAQAIIDGVAQEYTDLKLTEDLTTANSKSWLLCSVFGDPSSLLRHFINPSNYGALYTPELYEDDGAGNLDPTKRIYPTVNEWVLQYTDGILRFPYGVGSLTKPFHLKNLFRYIGNFGGAGGVVAANFEKEDLTSQIDGITFNFTTTHNYIAGSLEVQLNGIDQGTQGIGYFSETGSNTFTMSDLLVSPDKLIVKYIKQ